MLAHEAPHLRDLRREKLVLYAERGHFSLEILGLSAHLDACPVGPACRTLLAPCQLLLLRQLFVEYDGGGQA